MIYFKKPHIVLLPVLLSVFTCQSSIQAWQEIKLPKLTGMSVEEASIILHEMKLQMVAVPYPEARYEPGVVFKQKPIANKRIRSGTTVYLSFAVDENRVAVPDLTGLSLVEARSRLHANQLQLGNVDFRQTSERPPGTVLKQSEPVGSLMARGVPVDLIVASTSQRVVVRDLRAKNFTEAAELLQTDNLEWVAISDFASNQAPGTIVSHSPQAGEQTAVGTLIYLRVATGSQLVEVPNLTGKTLAEAEAILHELRLQMVGIPHKTSEHAPGVIYEQRPIAQTRAATGTPVYLNVASLDTSVQVVDIQGKTLEEASTILRQQGLQLLITAEARSDVAGGTVIRQHPSPGTALATGSPVRAIMAAPSGANPAIAELTNLVGKPLAEAAGLLQRQKLPVTIIEEPTDTAVPGTILRQYPPSGSKSAAGTPIRLVVATSQQRSTLEDLTGRSLSQARGRLLRRRLQVVPMEEITNEFEPGTVLRQFPEGGAAIAAGAPVYLVVAVASASEEAAESTLTLARREPGFSSYFGGLGLFLIALFALFLFFRVKKKPHPTAEKDASSTGVAARKKRKRQDVASVFFRRSRDYGRQTVRFAGLLASSERGSVRIAQSHIVDRRFDLRLRAVSDSGHQYVKADPPLVKARKSAKSRSDDLKKIEGIGPKISQILNTAGITTFGRLAGTDVKRLRKILNDANIRIADPGTWPEQARLAAKGKWDQLQTLQKKLKGGRRV